MSLFAELWAKKSDFPLLKLSFILGSIYMSQLQTNKNGSNLCAEVHFKYPSLQAFYMQKSPLWQYFNKWPCIWIANCIAQVFLSEKLVWYSLFKNWFTTFWPKSFLGKVISTLVKLAKVFFKHFFINLNVKL